MRDQAYWERWLRAAPEGARGGRVVGQGLVREAGVEKASAAPQGRAEGAEPRWREGKRVKKPPGGGRDGSKAEGTPYGAPRDRRGAEGGRTVGDACAHARGSAIVIPADPETPIVRIPGTPSPGRGRRTGAGSARSAAGRRTVVWAGRADPGTGIVRLSAVRADGGPLLRSIPRPGGPTSLR